MPTLLLPVEGLTVASPWQLGTVVLHSEESGRSAIDAILGADERPLTGSWLRVVETLRAGTVAEVSILESLEDQAARRSAVDIAADTVADALDLLRCFQYERAMTRSTMFGLPGELRIAHLQYLAADGPGRSWAGFRNDGEVLGSTFNDEPQAVFQSTVLARLAQYVGGPTAQPGPERARLAVRLLSQAIREHRHGMRTLNIVMAVEALLGPLRTMELAQHSVALTCGAPFSQACGRDWPACAYLAADLSVPSEYRAVKRLNDGPGDHICSEWFEFLARYDARSGVAHGDPTALVSEDDAGRDLYWAIKRLMLPAIAWLLDNPADPVSALTAEVRSRLSSAEADQLLGRTPNTTPSTVTP